VKKIIALLMEIVRLLKELEYYARRNSK